MSENHISDFDANPPYVSVAQALHRALPETQLVEAIDEGLVLGTDPGLDVMQQLMAVAMVRQMRVDGPYDRLAFNSDRSNPWSMLLPFEDQLWFWTIPLLHFRTPQSLVHATALLVVVGYEPSEDYVLALASRGQTTEQHGLILIPYLLPSRVLNLARESLGPPLDGTFDCATKTRQTRALAPGDFRASVDPVAPALREAEPYRLVDDLYGLAEAYLEAVQGRGGG